MKQRKVVLQLRGLSWFAVPLLMVATRASDTVAEYSLALTRNLYLSAACVWLVMYVAMAVLAIPVSMFQYRVDRKFDLARGTAKQRIIDALKANAIGVVFGLATVETVFFSMNLPGEYSWVWAAIGISFLYAALVYGMPNFLPLFYRLEPLKKEALSARLKALATHSGVQIEAVYEWHISGRTRRANAMVAGFGRNRKVILTDTMVENFDEDEIEALIAHEFGHCAHQDVGKRVALRGVLFLPVLWAVQAAILYELFPGTSGGWSNPAVVPVFWVMWLMLSLYSNLAMFVLTRRQEHRADRFAWEQLPSVQPFITGMKKITELNLVSYDKGSQWKHTHPATPERIAAAERYARERGQVLEAAVGVI
jgi:STE24 endopeptidase